MILQDPVRHLARRATQAGYTPFVVESIDLPLSHYDNIESLADAVVFVGAGDKEFCARIEQLTSGVATVAATKPINSRFPEFIWDEALGFELILGHLLKLGHKNIALLGGDSAERTGNPTRLRQYREACEHRGIEPVIIAAATEEDRVHSGQIMAAELLAIHREITAVIGRNIEFSIGALSEFQRQGLQVPRDLSLVSYTDDRIARGVWPPLTALHTPVQQAADLAFETALQMLEGKTVEHGPTVLPVELMVRESTGSPRKCHLPAEGSVSNPKNR